MKESIDELAEMGEARAKIRQYCLWRAHALLDAAYYRFRTRVHFVGVHVCAFLYRWVVVKVKLSTCMPLFPVLVHPA